MRPLRPGIDRLTDMYTCLSGNQNCIYFSFCTRFVPFSRIRVRCIACCVFLVANCATRVIVICNSHTSVGFRHVVRVRYTRVYVARRRCVVGQRVLKRSNSGKFLSSRTVRKLFEYSCKHVAGHDDGNYDGETSLVWIGRKFSVGEYFTPTPQINSNKYNFTH